MDAMAWNYKEMSLELNFPDGAQLLHILAARGYVEPPGACRPFLFSQKMMTKMANIKINTNENMRFWRSD